MGRRAEFLVSRIRYKGQNIEVLGCHSNLFKIGKLGKLYERMRTDVIEDIIRGEYRYMTVFINEDGIIQYGDEIHVVSVNNISYLRTDRNEFISDNLGALPNF